MAFFALGRLVCCFPIILGATAGPLAASTSVRNDFVPVSLCGLRADSRIVEVTTTDAAAPGGLLAALGIPGPKIITFAVGGVILPGRDIDVTTPYTTIAGETAPEPGITMTGATLRVRSHDVCIRHISVRPGSADSAEANSQRDGIAIGGNPKKFGGVIERVLLENVSVSWSVDENVSVWYPGTNTVQIRSAIIAEGLRKAGHPKVSHSMGMIVASDVTRVVVSDSIFAHNNDRNPRISPNSQVSIEENIVYNSGNMSTEIFLSCDGDQHDLSIVRNLYIPGKDTRSRRPQYVFVNSRTRQQINKPEECERGFAKVKLITADGQEAKRIYEERLKHAGSRPFNRNVEDARIIADVRDGTGRIRDTAQAIEPAGLRPSADAFVLPAAPFRIETNGQLAIANTLCKAHLKLGGLPFRGCPTKLLRQ